MKFKVGDEVVVTGKLDNRVRDKLPTGLIKGTIDAFLVEDQVSVILENMDLWVGKIREIAPLEEQE